MCPWGSHIKGQIKSLSKLVNFSCLHVDMNLLVQTVGPSSWADTWRPVVSSLANLLQTRGSLRLYPDRIHWPVTYIPDPPYPHPTVNGHAPLLLWGYKTCSKQCLRVYSTVHHSPSIKGVLAETSSCLFRPPATFCTLPPIEWSDRCVAWTPHQQSPSIT